MSAIIGKTLNVLKDDRVAAIRRLAYDCSYESMAEDAMIDRFSGEFSKIVKEEIIDDGKMFLFETVIFLILEGINTGVLNDRETQARPSDKEIARTSALCFYRLVQDYFPYRVYFRPLKPEESDQLTLASLEFAAGMTAVTITSGRPFFALMDENDAFLLRMAIPNSCMQSEDSD